MIQYQSQYSKKNIYIKIVAYVLLIVFSWNQVAQAGGDLFYFKPLSLPTATTFTQKDIVASATTQFDNSQEELEVTNYDLFSYKKNNSGIGKLLPSVKEQETAAGFAPGYLNAQQSKHENVIRQKEGIDDLLETLINGRRAREEVEPSLKKKRSGEGEGEAGGSPYDFSMTDPDEAAAPHNLNDFVNPANLTQINKYDITMRNIGDLMAGAEKKEDDEGVSYWLNQGEHGLEEDRLIMRVIYTGTGDDKKIDKIYLGFRLTAVGEYEAKYRIDYSYTGNDIAETRKYDVSEGKDRLVEKSIYEGTGDDNRLKKTIYYGSDGSVMSRRDFVYGTEGELKEALLYETDSEETGDGELIQKTAFSGEKNKEISDYSESYYTDKETGERFTTETTVYFYKNGKRASDVEGQEYRYSKSKQITYRGNVDSNGDGEISDDELAAARKISMLVYDDTQRLAGEETADYMVIYAKGDIIARTTVYFYKDGKRAKYANYRECMTSAATYYGDLDTDGDGKISDEELENGIKLSETFYYTQYRLKGEETQDYTLTYLTDGETIKDTTVYIYEGGKRASESDNEDRIEKEITYWGDALNEDGSVKEGAKKKSVTYKQFDVYTKRGEEVNDFTINYYRDGETARDTTVYFYSGNKRAVDATYRDGLERSATFWGDAVDAISLVYSDTGEYKIDAIIEFIGMRFGIDVTGSADDFRDALLSVIALGDTELASNILTILLNMDPTAVQNAEDILNTLLSLLGGNSELLLLLSVLDLTGAGSVEEAIRAMLIQAGMDEKYAALSELILSLKTSTTMGGFIDDLISAATTKELTEGLTSLLLEIGLGMYGSMEELINKLKSMTEDEELSALFAMEYESLEELLNGAKVRGILDKLLALLGELIKDVSYYVNALIEKMQEISGEGDLYDLLESMKFVTFSSLDVFMDTLIRDAASAALSDELASVFLEMGFDSKGSIEELIDYLTGCSLSPELLVALNIVKASTYTSLLAFIQDIKNEANTVSCLDELIELLGDMIVNPANYIENLASRLLMLMAGDDYSLKSLLGVFLRLDLTAGTITSPEDLLYAMIFTAGGEGLTELKDILKVEGTLSGNAVTLLQDIGTRAGVSFSTVNLIEQLIGLVNDEIIQDAELLTVLIDLQNDNPLSLIDLLFNQIRDDAIAPLLQVILNGQTDLLNLLLAVDLSSVTTAEELLDLLMTVDTDGDGVANLIEILLGTDPEDPSKFPTNFTYRYEIRDDAKLKSQTFFHIDRIAGQVPKSIADYTLSYSRTGDIIKDTTIYYYEDPNDGARDVRAYDADSDQRRTRIITYRNDARSSKLDFDGDGWGDLEEEALSTNPYDAEDYPAGSPSTDYSDDNGLLEDGSTPISEGNGNIAGDGIADEAIRASESFYFFHSGEAIDPFPYTIPGDEVVDYTYSYDREGVEIKETSVYLYEDGLRAAQYFENSYVTTDHRKEWVINYVGDVINRAEYDANGYIVDGKDGLVDAGLKKKTETKYYFDSLTTAGDEIADYTFTYMRDGLTLKSVTYYEYNNLSKDANGNVISDTLVNGAPGLRAEFLPRPDEPMTRTVTHRMTDNNIDGVIERSEVGTKISETYYDIHLGKGDEIADRSFSYTRDGLHIKTMSIYEYGITELANGASGSRAALTN
ncbi:MAG: hypothetical protein ABID09_02370, partial [Candidatus Omnitrophota bacterium]